MPLGRCHAALRFAPLRLTTSHVHVLLLVSATRTHQPLQRSGLPTRLRTATTFRGWRLPSLMLPRRTQFPLLPPL
jgi:hypothetical protein